MLGSNLVPNYSVCCSLIQPKRKRKRKKKIYKFYNNHIQAVYDFIAKQIEPLIEIHYDVNVTLTLQSHSILCEHIILRWHQIAY